MGFISAELQSYLETEEILIAATRYHILLNKSSTNTDLRGRIDERNYTWFPLVSKLLKITYIPTWARTI
jgi:hypothetical protein